jgi:hypothetical protein
MTDRSNAIAYENYVILNEVKNPSARQRGFHGILGDVSLRST